MVLSRERGAVGKLNPGSILGNVGDADPGSADESLALCLISQLNANVMLAVRPRCVEANIPAFDIDEPAATPGGMAVVTIAGHDGVSNCHAIACEVRLTRGQLVDPRNLGHRFDCQYGRASANHAGQQSTQQPQDRTAELPPPVTHSRHPYRINRDSGGCLQSIQGYDLVL
jgi:hypothetical protein